ncbi:MAG: N-acetyltransferase [Pseudomonadota bacterium]
MSFKILPERPQDAVLIDPLLDRAFGFDRKQKTVYRLREAIEPVAALSFSAIGDDGGFLASIRYWPVVANQDPGLLLGPLAVEPALQGQGIGRALVGHSLNVARDLGHGFCVIVGDPEYYRPFGFSNASACGLILPGPVDAERFLVAELAPDALEGVSGVIAKSMEPQRHVG